MNAPPQPTVPKLGESTIYIFESRERWALRKMGVDEWLIRTVMALYTEACTVVRTDAGLCESFEVKAGLHQGSVLSPLLFTDGMDVVSSEAFRVAVC